ncbi:MAG: TRAP transporter TatT component family protein [Gallionellaceae bacterium]|nr:TRAP transporter TatT component family protein [Gallionellaceae bacterium]
MNRFAAIALYLSLFFLLEGCSLHREAYWKQTGPNKPTELSETNFKAAQECFTTAADAMAVDKCIAVHDLVIKENPGNYQARANAATLYILKGTAYTQSSSAKSEAYSRAMTYAELAMYTNPDFKAQVDAGKQPWEAADTLGKAEVEAMYYWVTALQYEFKEGMSLPSKVINIKWLERALVFLDRIEKVDPDFGGGGVEVAKVICYLVLPERMGGSDAKGDEYMQRAVANHNDWLLPRWARGKYYYPVKGQQKAADADLAWVAAQNLGNYRDPYPWRVHFQSNAKQLLN